MGRNVRKCKALAEVAVMEKGAAAGRSKRRIVSPELSRSTIQLKTRRLAVERPEDSASPASSANSTCESVSSGHVLASKFPDPEENEETTVEFLTTSARHWREKTPVMQLESDSSAAEKKPTETELEQFFAAAEANLQKHFIDKYNYDIVKDEPLEGRYEWIQIELKP